MDGLLNWLVLYCINNKIVDADEEEWLRYGLEKRLSTLVVLLPFSILSIYISGFWTASFFIGSFFFLRSKTNGFHATSHLDCLIGSLLLEWLFLVLVGPQLNSLRVHFLLLFSVVVIFRLAPYDHPKMNLDYAEYFACRRASRIRILLLSSSCSLSTLFGLIEISKGISLGCAMASFLLVLANIFERRMKYDSNSDQDKLCSSSTLQGHD